MDSPFHQFVDLAGTYRDWFDDLDVNALLIRPDAYVFGGGIGLDSAEELARGFLTAVSDPTMHQKESVEAV